MCVVKTPKIQTPAASESQKPLPVLRNPILDGVDPISGALRIGRSSLRIDRTDPNNPNPYRPPTAATGISSNPAAPPAAPASSLPGVNPRRAEVYKALKIGF